MKTVEEIKKHRLEKNKKWHENNPNKNAGYCKNYRINKAKKEGRVLKSLIIECLECGENISNRFPSAIYCRDCNKKREKIRLRKRDRKKIGTTGLTSQLYRDINSIPDFEEERRRVNGEKKRTFKNGCSWLIYGKASIEWAKHRLDRSKKGIIRYLPPPLIVNFEDVCGHCSYAEFPNGINEKGICLLNKCDYIYDTSLMCWEIIQS